MTDKPDDCHGPDLGPPTPIGLPALSVSILYYGDNLDNLRGIRDETVDLCYIDPPFNSKRSYNQIYNNVGNEDRAQAQAFVDTWTWNAEAIRGRDAIMENRDGRFQPKTIELIKGLKAVLGEGSLLAYLVSLTLRIVEIHRVLKRTGSFYLHCDPTASHYLKIVADSIFCSQGGDFKNEIVWQRTYAHGDAGGQGAKHFGRIHDILLFYTKGDAPYFGTVQGERNLAPFKHVDPDGRRWQSLPIDGPGGAAKGNPSYEVMGVTRYWRYSKDVMEDLIARGLVYQSKPGAVPRRKGYLDEAPEGSLIQDMWSDIQKIASQAKERLGYPTQKPEALLERIITASCPEGGVVLDAYCGCGTTVAVAQRVGREWIGMDITYQSISLILRRLEDHFGKKTADAVTLSGVPRDIASAIALAHKKDDRVRKEFEKWAVLTYSNNRATINEKKGADKGIDGTAYFMATAGETAKMVFQVKSGGVKRGDIATLDHDRTREGAAMATLITLEPPTGPMAEEALGCGLYHHQLMGRDYPVIQIVTVQQIIEEKKRLDLPMGLAVIKKAPAGVVPDQPKEQLGLLHTGPASPTKPKRRR